MKQHIIERLLYVTLLLTFISVGIGVTLQRQSNARLAAQQNILQEQGAGQKAVLKGMQTLLANQGKTTEEINKSLSCILVFFSSPNRASFYISNFTTCTITNSRTGQSEVLPLPQVQNTNDDPGTATPIQPDSDRNIADNQQPSQQPQEPPETTPPPTTPLTPPGAVERLGHVLNDTLGEVPKVIKNVFNLITP